MGRTGPCLDIVAFPRPASRAPSTERMDASLDRSIDPQTPLTPPPTLPLAYTHVHQNELYSQADRQAGTHTAWRPRPFPRSTDPSTHNMSWPSSSCSAQRWAPRWRRRPRHRYVFLFLMPQCVAEACQSIKRPRIGANEPTQSIDPHVYTLQSGSGGGWLSRLRRRLLGKEDGHFEGITREEVGGRGFMDTACTPATP